MKLLSVNCPFPLLTLCSTGPELHHRHHCLLDCRAADDLGLLW